jgi:hypothetical protein
MTHEERARRYLEASRAASVHERGSEGRAIHEGTMRRLEREHPVVREHALVGAGQDFDEPLNRNELEHQRELRRQQGMTNTETAERRRQLRAADFGRRARHTPAEIFDAANPSRARATPERRRRAGAGPSRRARRTLARAASGPVRETGSILGELFVAGVALSLLYLLLTSEQQGGRRVPSTILELVTGGFRRLASPTSDLFTAVPKATSTARTARTPAVSPARAGVSSPAALAQRQGSINSLFGPLPSFSSVTPTIP